MNISLEVDHDTTKMKRMKVKEMKLFKSRSHDKKLSFWVKGVTGATDEGKSDRGVFHLRNFITSAEMIAFNADIFERVFFWQVCWKIQFVIFLPFLFFNKLAFAFKGVSKTSFKLYKWRKFPTASEHLRPQGRHHNGRMFCDFLR